MPYLNNQCLSVADVNSEITNSVFRVSDQLVLDGEPTNLMVARSLYQAAIVCNQTLLAGILTNQLMRHDEMVAAAEDHFAGLPGEGTTPTYVEGDSLSIGVSLPLPGWTYSLTSSPPGCTPISGASGVTSFNWITSWGDCSVPGYQVTFSATNGIVTVTRSFRVIINSRLETSGFTAAANRFIAMTPASAHTPTNTDGVFSYRHIVTAASNQVGLQPIASNMDFSAMNNPFSGDFGRPYRNRLTQFPVNSSQAGRGFWSVLNPGWPLYSNESPFERVSVDNRPKDWAIYGGEVGGVSIPGSIGGVGAPTNAAYTEVFGYQGAITRDVGPNCPVTRVGAVNISGAGIIGGETGWGAAGAYTSTNYSWQGNTNTWTLRVAYPSAIGYTNGMMVSNSRNVGASTVAIVVSGCTSGNNAQLPLASLSILDFSANTWTSKAIASSARASFPYIAAWVDPDNDDLYVYGTGGFSVRWPDTNNAAHAQRLGWWVNTTTGVQGAATYLDLPAPDVTGKHLIKYGGPSSYNGRNDELSSIYVPAFWVDGVYSPSAAKQYFHMLIGVSPR